MPRHNDMPIFQEVDLNRTLIGQVLKHDIGWAATRGKDFVVEGFALRSNWRGEIDLVAVGGSQLKKDGTPGQVAGECRLRFDEVPTVDFEAMLRTERNQAVQELQTKFTVINQLRNVLTERKVRLDPHDLEVDRAIGNVIDLHVIAELKAKDDDDG